MDDELNELRETSKETLIEYIFYLTQYINKLEKQNG